MNQPMNTARNAVKNIMAQAKPAEIAKTVASRVTGASSKAITKNTPAPQGIWSEVAHRRTVSSAHLKY